MVFQRHIYFFGDGRDTNPRSSDIMLWIEKIGKSNIAFETFTVKDPLSAIRKRVSKDETDEFLKPTIVNEEGIIKATCDLKPEMSAIEVVMEKSSRGNKK
ncbi:hypothetical protein C1645_813639 [Glomus cerebriforme]|uniref:Uncharacterized protein n=1 Tax=Glomus cerebriforme TaxID=658196 RepID=A0A397TMU7_9GLOM|nr:hypothetical protein C1645_813639 [Glomus cerebriforme]